jgi:hypothetical protein
VVKHSASVIFTVLTAVQMKIQVFWDMKRCALAVTDISEKLAASIIYKRHFLGHFQGGGNTLLRNVGSYLPVYMASCTRRLESTIATQNLTAYVL